MNSYRALRRELFSARLPLDQRLTELSRPYPTHFFLANPASQNSYLFLLRYLREFSERWFEVPSSRLSILDWGCGKGFCSYLLGKQSFRVTGCDVARSADDSAFGQETPIIKAENIDVISLDDEVRLPFEDASFDIVLSMGVLEHVKDDFRSLQEIRRILASWSSVLLFSALPSLVDPICKPPRRQQLSRPALYQEWNARASAPCRFHCRRHVHRQLLPRNSVRYPAYHLFEALDQTLVRFTPLRLLTTNIEFVASVPPTKANRPTVG